jgi:hypothetical protein
LRVPWSFCLFCTYRVLSLSFQTLHAHAFYIPYMKVFILCFCFWCYLSFLSNLLFTARSRVPSFWKLYLFVLLSWRALYSKKVILHVYWLENHILCPRTCSVFSSVASFSIYQIRRCHHGVLANKTYLLSPHLYTTTLFFGTTV